MSKLSILFDLDGTLTDSGEGIMNCAAEAFRQLGLEIPTRQQLRTFVGPPLSESFAHFHVPDSQIPEALRIFRKRYDISGKFENIPYAGIHEALDILQSQGFSMYVATSKVEDKAIEILEHFKLAPYFSKICGGSYDSSRSAKDQVIAYLLEQIGYAQNTVMVGDTVYDVKGAAVHGIPTIGVAWGYGDVQDMLSAGAAAIAQTPQELVTLLNAQ